MNFLLCENKGIKALSSSEAGNMRGDTRIAQTRSSANCLMNFERKQEAKGRTYKGGGQVFEKKEAQSTRDGRALDRSKDISCVT